MRGASMKNFVDREQEMETLLNEYERSGSSLVVLYGRRRVGKTTLISEFIKDKNALFISREHRRISNQMVQKTVEKYLAKAGLEHRHFSTHKLRHTAATLIYQSGKVDVRVLKDILGHEQLNTTQIYTHIASGQMEDAMEQNPLSGVINIPKDDK